VTKKEKYMKVLNFDKLNDYIRQKMSEFEQQKIKQLQTVTLNDLLLPINPYLWSVKGSSSAGDLIVTLLERYFSADEEKKFDDLLKSLAIFIAGQTFNGQKSDLDGIDLEFIHNETHYAVSIQPGPEWAKNYPKEKLEKDFQNTLNSLKQSDTDTKIQPVLGLCYGKAQAIHSSEYLTVVGQDFWFLISENENLYKDIIESINFGAKKSDFWFSFEQSKTINLLTLEFINTFCVSGKIDWGKIVEFHSKKS
jgi:hypothetical protein